MPCILLFDLLNESEVPQMFDNSNKLEGVRLNLTGFFQDIVKFIQDVWETLKKFFKLSDSEDPTSPLVAEESEAE